MVGIVLFEEFCTASQARDRSYDKNEPAVFERITQIGVNG